MLFFPKWFNSVLNATDYGSHFKVFLQNAAQDFYGDLITIRKLVLSHVCMSLD